MDKNLLLRGGSAPSSVLALFDIDGTMLTMWPTHEKTFASMFNELYDVPNVNFRNYYIPGETDEQDVWRTLKAMGYPDHFIRSKIRKVAPTLAKYFSMYCRDAQVTVLEGVRGLLDRLKEASNVTVGVVTGNPPEKYRLLLGKARLNGYFSFVAGSEVDENRKGRLLGGIRLAEENTGLHYKPNDVYFFDDSDASIPVSRKLGINSVAVATGDVPYEKLKSANPDYLLRNLGDIRAVLRILPIEKTADKGIKLKSH
ncbi:MAG: HAD hydrolase-like protein [Candidatus Micrarchaeaceae archaeon]|jgi:phosphoglycolate phosphatase-like HAD superfamily hydrolase